MDPLMIYQNDPRFKRKSNFANKMLSQGTQTSPVQHPAQAWARLAQGLVGGWMAGEADKELTGREDRYRQTLADSLTAATERGPDVPGVADQVSAPEGNFDPITPPPTPGAPGGMDALIKALQGNPDTADMAFKAQVGQMGAEQAHQRTMDLMRAKVGANIAATGAKEKAKLPYKQALKAAPGPSIAGRDRPLTADVQTQRVEVAGAEQAAKSSAQLKSKRQANMGKASTALTSMKRKSKFLVKVVDRALSNVSAWTTGYGAALAGLPQTDARALANDLNTIKANIGFDRLAEMRANSPTGGALGNVSEMENKLLQAVQGALDPYQREQLKQNLGIIKELYPQVLAEREGAFKNDYQQFLGAPGGSPTGAPATSEFIYVPGKGVVPVTQ